MRLAALGLGLLGAFAGFVGALLVILVGGIGGLFAAEGAATVTLLGIVALGASTLGLIGAALAIPRPRLAVAALGASAVIGVVTAALAYVPAAILLGVAAVLAFMGRQAGPRTYVQRYDARG